MNRVKRKRLILRRTWSVDPGVWLESGTRLFSIMIGQLLSVMLAGVFVDGGACVLLTLTLTNGVLLLSISGIQLEGDTRLLSILNGQSPSLRDKGSQSGWGNVSLWSLSDQSMIWMRHAVPSSFPRPALLYRYMKLIHPLSILARVLFFVRNVVGSLLSRLVLMYQ